MSGTQSNEPILHVMGFWWRDGFRGLSRQRGHREALLEVLRYHFGDREYMVREVRETDRCDCIVRVLGEMNGQTDRRFTVEMQGEQ